MSVARRRLAWDLVHDARRERGGHCMEQEHSPLKLTANAHLDTGKVDAVYVSADSTKFKRR